MHNQNRLAIASTGLAYFLIAAGTIFLTRDGLGIATIWPANAILLAMIWTLPKRRWAPYFVCCFAGNLLANVLLHASWLASLPFGLANMAEVALAGHLLGRTRNSAEAFGNIRLVIRFCFIAGMVVPALSALLGAATANHLYGADFARAYATWFAADALGLLIVAPVALMVRDGELVAWYRQLPASAKSRSAALLAVVALSAICVFGQSRFPLLFLVFAPTILAACRLGRVGAALSVVTVAAIGTAATLQDIGPISLVHGDPWTRILIFQVFLAVLMMTALPAAAEVDQRRLLISKLAEREGALLLLLDQSSDLILNFDLDGNCLFASGSSSSLGAYSPMIVVGANVVDLPHSDDAIRAKANHEAAIKAPTISHRCEYRMSDKHGEWFWVEANTRALTDADGQLAGTVSVLRDVSHHKRREADLHMAATTDELTGLANRAGFFTAFERIIETSQDVECWLGILDIDHFKSINDEHGHLAGDEVLKTVADRLRAELRVNDLVGRVGGEEFAVVLVGCGEPTATQVFERLRECVARRPVALSGEAAIRVTLSAGFVALSASHSRDEILAAADAALYFSKRSGRNRVTLGSADFGPLAA